MIRSTGPYLGFELLFELEDGPPKGEDEPGSGATDDSPPLDSIELLLENDERDDETKLEDGRV